ncbi:MAG TPA: holo-ACP synthase [Candidatus Limosilactobacillus merdigallinarum]|uniref:Holo-[acyl-carrier-protein] synthase n=1 Tax=Candidatus Limosilactobacillus merdigallinarum TaxID=2838652 RepID=A0A9D2AKI2_9LACO|nr:holo-ACP synthase [Candidatus Limosilactobacillus merdigallinarum]
MIAGVGIDLLEIDRVKQVVQAEPRFVEKVLTPGERQQLSSLHKQRYWEYVAGRFSIKESFGKAMGTGIGARVGFQDVEIIDNDQGKPEVLRSPYDGQALVSVSHTKDLVMTEVLLQTND